MTKVSEIDAKIAEVLVRRRRLFSFDKYSLPFVVLDLGTTSINHKTAHITYAAIITPKVDMVVTGPAEQDIIITTLKILSKYQEGTLIGFNHTIFDIPILQKRMLHYNIQIPFKFKNVLDIRLFLSDGNPFMRGTLEEYAEVLNFKERCSGWWKSCYELLWQDPNIESLKEYLLYDVKATNHIFLYLKGELDEKINSLSGMQQPRLCQSRQDA